MSNKLHYHLIGIGGSGMSAIAQILRDRGETVSGSDRQESETTRRLSASGIGVHIGHDGGNINGADVVVYSAAIPPDNPEIQAARERGIPVLERPAMLGEIMKPYRHRVAVSGTHGKTTTTSMLNCILEEAALDATALIGGDLKTLGGNAKLGRGSIIITEACEAFESFLHLHPSIAVITNIDADHLDYYGTIEDIQESFRQFLTQVDPDGCVIACSEDPRVRTVAESCGRQVVWFGLSGSPDVGAGDVDISNPEPTFTLVRNGSELGQVSLGVPGKQNIVDALAAAAAAFELGAGFDHISAALRGFRGASRRFEIMYDNHGVMVVDDYAHHPVEIKATLASARAAYDKRLIAVFQPHLYSRTRIFLNDFADALSIADQVMVAPIYASRERPQEGVSAGAIVKRMEEFGFANAAYAPDKDLIARDLASRIGEGDMVIVLGAGDIRTVSEELASLLSERVG